MKSSTKAFPVVAFCVIFSACSPTKPADNAVSDDDQGAAGSPVQDQQQTLQYWTEARLRAAEHIPNGATGPVIERPLPGGDQNGYASVPRPYKTSTESRITGALFFRDNANRMDTHCSASVVESQSKSVIVTAAHCVLSGALPAGQAWMSHVLFVPAYDGAGMKGLKERAPYGLWPVRRAFVTEAIAQYPIRVIDARYDLALVSVFPNNGMRLQDAVAGAWQPRIVSTHEEFTLAQILGYPADPYDGGSQRYCQTRLGVDIYSGGFVTPNCGVTSGNSGGPVTIGSKIIGVVHGRDQTRLLGSSYPSLAQAADNDASESTRATSRQTPPATDPSAARPTRP